MKTFKEWNYDRKMKKEYQIRRIKEAEELQSLMDELKQSTSIETIEEIERRTFYDVTFKVTFQDGNEVKVTLDEMRNLKDFILMIKKLDEVTEASLRSLDERHKIYYD